MLVKLQVLKVVGAGLFSLGMASSVNAALVSKLGDQVVYDTDLNVTWLANANLAASNTFGVSGIAADGSMTWDTANSWIIAMNTFGGTGYLGFNDWRLPVTTQPDVSCSGQGNSGAGFPLQGYGSGCTASEMGHLNNVEGVHFSSFVEPSPFTNIQYIESWSATEFAPDTSMAWAYSFDLGGQGIFDKTNPNNFAWAVRSGDVNTVPIPAAVWLFSSGLIGLLSVAKRKR